MQRVQRKEPDGIEIPGEEKVLWLNKGGTHILRSGKRIKTGQRFKEYPSLIPDSFRDKIVPVDQLPGSVPLQVIEQSYRVISHEGDPTHFAVLDVARGKIISDKPLTEAEAKKYCDELME